VEALLRLQDSEFGPAQFVPIAEATGIITRIGRWLWQEASRQHRTWLNHGLPAIPIAVNVSAIEFRNPDFASRFEQTLQEHGIGSAALQLEVTETAVMDDIEHAVTVLSRLQKLGVTILLDDFGTGQSSLAYLVRLPLNKVKIDKSFVASSGEGSAGRAVTNAMIALGQTLDLEVVAEGVETQDVLDYIRSNGCSQAQGYLLGMPMSGADFEDWYWEQQMESLTEF
jgi:EAL domain-containing protein (putative c-di-GMP-specific phosphodiesterase class I)